MMHPVAWDDPNCSRSISRNAGPAPVRQRPFDGRGSEAARRKEGADMLLILLWLLGAPLGLILILFLLGVSR